MACKIVESESKMLGLNEAIVVIEGSYDEVSASDIKAKALEKANQLSSGPWGFNRWTGPYPILNDGQAAETPEAMIQLRKEALILNAPQRYRNDFHFCKRGI